MVNQWLCCCRNYLMNLRGAASKRLGQCWLCAAPEVAHCGCCATCFADLPRPPPLNLRPQHADDYCQAWVAALYYQPPVDTWLHHFKFRSHPHLAKHLAPLLAAQVVVYHKQHRFTMPQCLVAVPMPVKRWQQRGYNQALLLCRELSLLLGIPYYHALHLSASAEHEQRAQHQLSRAQRQQHLRTRYRATRTFDGGHIVVVDDIITSGSTLNAAALALLGAGADTVSGWALAYTPAAHKISRSG